MEVRKSVLLPFPVEGMFDLIEAAEHYPDFLPWCSEATVLSRDEDVVSARITVDYHRVRFQFMAIRVEQGPFRHFEGEWRLAPLAAAACKVEFFLRYEFQSAAMAKLAGPVFDNIANTLVDAYVRRAEQVFGGKAAGRSD